MQRYKTTSIEEINAEALLKFITDIKTDLNKFRAKNFMLLICNVAKTDDINRLNNYYIKWIILKIFNYAKYLVAGESGVNEESYCFILLGSLGLNQATLFSDIEYAILLRNNSGYAKTIWRQINFVLLLMIVLLEETVIPHSKTGKALDKYLRQGLSIDLGGHTPLGKTTKPYDLVCTTNEIAMIMQEKRFDKPSMLLNLLPVIVEKASFLSGDKGLYRDYTVKTSHILSRKSSYYKKIMFYVVQIFVRSKYLMKPIEAEHQIRSIKHDMYRVIERSVYWLSSAVCGVPGDLRSALYNLCIKNYIDVEERVEFSKLISYTMFMRSLIYYIYQEQRDNFSTRWIFYHNTFIDIMKKLLNRLISYVSRELRIYKYSLYDEAEQREINTLLALVNILHKRIC